MASGKPEAENELEIYGELKREWSNYGDYMQGYQLRSHKSNSNLEIWRAYLQFHGMKD